MREGSVVSTIWMRRSPRALRSAPRLWRMFDPTER
jgi:hypothetical protein